MKTYARHHGLVASRADDEGRHHALRRSAGRVGGSLSGIVRLSGTRVAYADAALISASATAPHRVTTGCVSWGLIAMSRTEWRGVLIAVLLCVFQQLSGIYTILYYAPVFLTTLSDEFNISSIGAFGLILTMGVNCLFSFAPIFVIDKVGGSLAKRMMRY